MNYLPLRKKICNIGKILYNRGLISGTDGNISLKISYDDVILITPTGYNKGFLRCEDISAVKLNGGRAGHISGKTPTSELTLHIEVYKRRPDIKAIIHSHAPWTNALYLSQRTIDGPALLIEAAYVIGRVEVIPYYPPGSKELALEVGHSLSKCPDPPNVCIMMRHGMVACGKNLEAAFNLAEAVESCAKTTILTYLLKNDLKFPDIT